MLNKYMEALMLQIAVYVITGLLLTNHGGSAQTSSPGECSAIPRDDCYTSNTAGVTASSCLGITGCKWCPVGTPGIAWCIDGCDATSSAIDCFFTPTANVNAQTCNNVPYCSKYCTASLPAGVPRCQVNYYDCLVEARMDAKPVGSVGVSKQSCLQNSPTGLWCPHRTPSIPWCITPQPAAARCYQGVQPQFGSGLTTAVTCRQNGGVWCDRGVNANKCIALPTTATASCTPPIRYQCVIGAIANPTETLCIQSGCRWCPLAGQVSCIHGISTECIREQRVECAPGQSPTQTTCTTTLGCDYCPLTNTFSCIKKPYSPSCYVNPRTPCPSPSVNSSTTALQCASFGCLHCTDRTSEPRCIANPNATCLSCNCTTKTNCLTEMASTQANCLAKNCLWCPQNDSSVPNCIVFDNQGVSVKGVLSPCTVPCGGGTQFMHSNSCVSQNILECPRIFQVCNVQACPSNVTCNGTLRQRYQNMTSMCCETNSVCGIHSQSNPTGRRRKRVIAGAVSNSTWPWMGCIETGPTTMRCGVVLIKITASTAYALSSATCTSTQFTVGVTQARFATGSCSSGGTLYTITGRTVLGAGSSPPSDLVLLTLNLVGAVSSPPPAPICLPNGEGIAVGSQCYLLGYGSTDGQNPLSFSANLREVAMTIQPFSVCMTAWSGTYTGLMESQLICAGSLVFNGAAPCGGDIGGPLMCQRCTSCAWYLAGTATIASGCGFPNRPSLFIRMSAFETSFVRNQMGVEPLPEPTNVTFSCP